MQAKSYDKVVGEVNPDAWLNASIPVSMNDALQVFKQEYLTSLGSSANELAPEKIYDTINESFKAQLKFNHHLEKVVASELADIQTKWKDLAKASLTSLIVNSSSHKPPKGKC